MRKAEATFAKGKKESKEEFKSRLRRTALSTSTSTGKKAVGAMYGHVQALIDAKGKLFTE